jgi:hypothetical protein
MPFSSSVISCSAEFKKWKMLQFDIFAFVLYIFFVKRQDLLTKPAEIILVKFELQVLIKKYIDLCKNIDEFVRVSKGGKIRSESLSATKVRKLRNCLEKIKIL